MKRKIIVLTPTKNESWIIEHFLQVTSQFADHIIIADQNSEDNTVEICKRFLKVTIIENANPSFNEDERQLLLINYARSNFPGENVLLALDADEIASAPSINSNHWNKLREAAVGSVFYFEKPDLFPGLNMCVRHKDSLYPMAFVDDGSIIHHTKKVHSIRIPVTSQSIRVEIDNIVFLHYSYVRSKVQRAKFRFYSVQEAMLASSPWYRRRRRYRAPNHLLPTSKGEPVEMDWFDYSSIMSVTPFHFEDNQDCWYDKMVQNILDEQGGKKFWLDDIWDKEWNKTTDIKPPFLIQLLARLSDIFNK